MKTYKLKRKITNTLVILLFLISSCFIGLNFDKIRIFISGESDTKIYRDICESINPLFIMAFDNGNFRFSILEEINSFINSIFDVDFKYPSSIINSKITLLYDYNKLIEAQKQDLNNQNALGERKGNRFKTGESSLEFSDKHEFNQSWSQKSGKFMFTKEADIKFDVDELLAKPFKIDYTKKGPKVLIYHTHTSESYVAEANAKGVSGQNSNNGVVAVGERLSQRLRNDYGIEVIHNATVNDRPDSNLSYGKALNTVSNILKSYPSIKVVLDIHRDGISNTQKFRPFINVGGKNASKIMMVIGTNYTGLEHPNWKSNLTMALNIQSRLEELCKGITRPITISKNRYNQHVTNYAIIIEVGGDGNTLEESLESTKYMARAISDVIGK